MPILNNLFNIYLFNICFDKLNELETSGAVSIIRLSSFSNYAKFRVSSQIDLHRVTTVWFIFLIENLHALDFNILEKRIPRQAVLDVM